MSRGIKRKLKQVREQVAREISGFAHRNDGKEGVNYAMGLASEGYAGGYRDALDDVLLALNGIPPDRRGWWPTAHGTAGWASRWDARWRGSPRQNRLAGVPSSMALPAVTIFAVLFAALKLNDCPWAVDSVRVSVAGMGGFPVLGAAAGTAGLSAGLSAGS